MSATVDVYKIADCQCCRQPVMSDDPDMHVDVSYGPDGDDATPCGFTCYRCIETVTFACGHTEQFISVPGSKSPDNTAPCWSCRNGKPVANEDPFGDE